MAKSLKTLKAFKHKMPKFCITNLTEQDVQWMKLKLRNDFDAPRQSWQYQECLDIIHRAERMGFKELAAQMQADFNSEVYKDWEELPTRQQVTGEPSVSHTVEGILGKQPIENNMQLEIQK